MFDEFGVVPFDVVSFVFEPVLDIGFSSGDSWELLIRPRFVPGSRDMTRGFRGEYEAISINSTKLSLCSQTRVGDTVVGRVNVAEIVYPIEPFSNYST